MKFIKAKGEDKQESIIIRLIVRIDTDQIVEIGEHHLQVGFSIDRVIKEGCNMLVTIEMTLGEVMLKECKIIEVNILEEDIEVTLEMTIMEEVEVGLGKTNI